MKRRSLFQLAICAVAVSAMEVFGMKPITAHDPDVIWRNVYSDNAKDRLAYFRALMTAYSDTKTADKFFPPS